MEEFDQPLYNVIRFYEGDTPPRIIKRGVPLSVAQAHCKDPETNSKTCTNRDGRARTKRLGHWVDRYEQCKR